MCIIGVMSNKKFWDKEYSIGGNFSLSDRPSEDLVKFTRWLERNYGRQFLNPMTNILDIGSGNGRNLIFLSKNFGCRGEGYDISEVAVKKAKEFAKGLPVNFFVRSMEEDIDRPAEHFDMALDMMASHYLVEEKRKNLAEKIAFYLKSGGWLLLKTFLLDEDINAKRMIRESPAGEKNSYIHPTIGVLEHVYTEEEIKEIYGLHFDIKKVEKTGKHLIRGRAGKRRSIIVYMRRK